VRRAFVGIAGVVVAGCGTGAPNGADDGADAARTGPRERAAEATPLQAGVEKQTVGVVAGGIVLGDAGRAGDSGRSEGGSVVLGDAGKGSDSGLSEAGGVVDAAQGIDAAGDVDAAAGGDAGVPDGGATDGGAAGGGIDGGAEADVADGADADGAGAVCGFDAGVQPKGLHYCGDGWRDPTEECDDGLGASAARRGCSAVCQVLDELAVAPVVPDSGPVTAARTLGDGRHPVAVSDGTFAAVFVDESASALSLSLSLATFGAKGAATGIVDRFSAGPNVVQSSNPVIAGLPCNRYAVAWADLDTEGGDELDIALKVVDPSQPTSAPPVYANSTTSFSQFDPDIVWTGGELVVAWVDTSDPATEPDIRFRTFDANLNPTSPEQTLAATADSEADVALALEGGQWAAAWRDDAGGLETIQVQMGSVGWSIAPPFLPAPAASKPALAPLDVSHWLLVYTVGVDDADSGVANGSKIQAALLDVRAPGAVQGIDVPATALSAIGLDQSRPNALTLPGATPFALGTTYIAWWTASAAGDPNGEEVWLKAVGWDGTRLDFSAAEMPLPRWPQARLGDQKAPAMALSNLPPSRALVTAWDDLGGGLAAGEGKGDVAVELIPAPPLRNAADGGP
jgi:cysteine-rich repeat protein